MNSLRFAKEKSESFMKAAKEVLDSGSPYPIASEGEKQRRQEHLHALMEKYKGD
jgi:hypothetical protein